MELLGDRILHLRNKLALPRAQFALLVDVSQTALFNYESGTRIPPANIVVQICAATKANPSWLLTGEGPIYLADFQKDCGRVAAELVDTLVHITDTALTDEQRNALVDIAYLKILNLAPALNEEMHVEGKDLAAKIIDATNLFKGKASPQEENNVSTPSSRKRSPKASTSIVQNARGKHIVQAGGDINGTINMNIKSTSQKISVDVQPPNGTIGANTYLVQRITKLFNELGLRREERFGKTAYPVMYNEFKKHFSIPKTQKYTTYLLWPESRSEEILQYLEAKLDNTIKGRKIKAAARKGHSMQHLLAETKKLHEMLGWSEQEYKARLHYMFGVTSRSELNPSELANYVAFLKEQVDEQY